MREFKVVVLGSGGVGKSALTVKFVTGRFEEKYDPTIEDFYRKEITVGGMPSMLEILDTAGAEQFASLQDLYIKNGQGFLIVYSITSLQSFLDVQSIFDRIVKVKSAASSAGKTPSSSSKVRPSRAMPPIVLVGNKIDLEEQREVSPEVGEALARRFGCSSFFETSARNGANVNPAFLDVVRLMAEPPEQAAGQKSCGVSCSVL